MLDIVAGCRHPVCTETTYQEVQKYGLVKNKAKQNRNKKKIETNTQDEIYCTRYVVITTARVFRGRQPSYGYKK